MTQNLQLLLRRLLAWEVQKSRFSIPMLLALSLCLFSTSIFAQSQQNVRGTVVDGSGEPVPGVTVQVEGSSRGAITDLDGSFTIQAASNETLLFSFVGFQTVRQAVGNQTTFSITLEEDTQSLDEVVVVGYGSQRERDLISSISSVKTEDITKTPAPNAMQSLQGRVAGVQIVSNGAPGAGPTVRVRGIGSFEGGGAPLYVVDGMFFDNIDFLNPNDIESINILKDASAAAIYGVRAGNGVVLIETKGGSYNKKGELVYESFYGFQNPQNVLRMANTEQFVRYVNETGSAADIQFIQNAIERFGANPNNPELPNVDTNWYREIMSPAPMQSHSLSFNGGNETTRYSIGGTYFDQKGLLSTQRNEFQRLNFRVKVDSYVKDWLNVGANINVTTQERFNQNDAAWFNAYFAVPTLPVMDPQNTAANPIPYGNAQLLGYRGTQNPFFALAFNDNLTSQSIVLGNIFADATIIPDKLTFRTQYNYTVNNFSNRNVNFPFNDGVTERLSSLSRSNTNIFDQIWDNFLTYEEKFGKHRLTAVLGQSFRSETSQFQSARGEDLNPAPNRNNEEFWFLSNALNIDENSVNDGASRLFFLSYFTRLAYNYDDRFLLYGTFRRDGNNKFQQRWGNFFTFGAGYVLSEEKWFNSSWVDYLKIRGSWGQLGNDGINPSVGAPTLVNTQAAIGDVLRLGRRLSPTFDLIDRWETTIETNIGLNALFFNNRLSVDADYFIRDTRNLAVVIIPPVIRASERRSVGAIRNQGLEVTVGWQDQITKDFSYYVGGNFATLNNRVLDLGGPIGLDAGSAEFRQRSIIGMPFQAFYGFEVEGVFQNQEQIDNSGLDPEFIAANNLQPGDLRFRDLNGDGIINDEDRTVLGSFLPSLTYGANLGFTYKNWDFSMLFQGQSGFTILNRRRGEIIFTNDTNIDAELAEGLWRGEGTSDRFPSAAGLRRGWNQNMSEFYLEDGSYWRIQNIRLAYSFVDKSVLGVKMPRTTLAATAERPLTVFSYSGFNPEIPNGIDRQVHPVPAIYTLALTIKL
ncbi:MAG: SusC/RagA family TonB-linked outer membrane protein [Nitritalea sp.]